MYLNTSNTNGNIQISNNNGLGSGTTSILVGSGGFNLTTNTLGNINIISQAGTTNFINKTANNSQNMIIGLENNTNSSLILKSSGINSAIQIITTNSTGNINITQPQDSNGQVSIVSGKQGFNVSTQTGGSIIMTTFGASSLYTNTTVLDNQDLNITVTGNTNSKVNISSSGTGNNAINLSTSNGGILVTANSNVQMESNSGSIQIATSNPAPIFLGTVNSTTTIYGNLDVKGTVSQIESTVVTVADNMIVVNNAPSGTGNGGLTVKRYQPANDNSFGDVVSDSPDLTGNVASGFNTITTIHFDLNANSTDNYYNGWWVKITGGTGQYQVRRIKSYTGSTRVATIFGSSDQTTQVPIEGLNFSTIPDTTSIYSLYPCEFVSLLWDENNDEFALTCNADIDQPFVHYSDLHINNLNANNVLLNTINGSNADTTVFVILNNNSTDPVTITNFPSIYGIYNIMIKPLNDPTRTHAIFNIGRINAVNIPGVVNRPLPVQGIFGDSLDMQWPQNSLPQLMYRSMPNGISGTTVFQLKIISL